jgi:hypothetical protein
MSFSDAVKFQIPLNCTPFSKAIIPFTISAILLF